jgi:hypothetical protein
MTNRTLAVLGIATYLLSVYSSATDLNGQPAVPQYVIIGSGIASVLFAITATIRLWKIKKLASMLFSGTSVLLFCAELIKVTTLPDYGSLLIIAINIIMVIAFLSFFYAVIVLWRTKVDLD